MILDKLAQLSDSQAFTTDDYCTKSYDRGAAIGQGAGEPLAIIINVEVAGTGAGVYEFQAIQSAVADLTSNVVMAAIRPLEAALTAGAILILDIPPMATPLQYIGLYFNNVSGSTAVTVSAHVAPRSFAYAYKAQAKGYLIS
jgi:hypothetical protein